MVLAHSRERGTSEQTFSAYRASNPFIGGSSDGPPARTPTPFRRGPCMCQTFVGTVGSEYWTRSYQMQARACAVLALIGVLTGCLESAHVLSQTLRDVKPVVFDDGPENVLPARLQRSSPPGPS